MAQAGVQAKKSAPTKEEVAAIGLQLVDGDINLNEALLMLEKYDTTAIAGCYITLQAFCDRMKNEDVDPRKALIELLDGFLATGLLLGIEAIGNAESITADSLEQKAYELKTEGKFEEAFEILSQAIELRKKELDALKKSFINCHKT